MTSRASMQRVLVPGLGLLAGLVTACGGASAPETNSREIPWTYGPTTGGATAQHVRGTGTKGGDAVAKGWQCRLHDGKRLTIRPYQLAAEHPLFGKVAISIGLFDREGAQIEMVRSATITAQNASFSFDIAPASAARLQDVVIWYVEP